MQNEMNVNVRIVWTKHTTKNKTLPKCKIRA